MIIVLPRLINVDNMVGGELRVSVLSNFINVKIDNSEIKIRGCVNGAQLSPTADDSLIC